MALLKDKLWLLLVTLVCTTSVWGAKILMMPALAPSHVSLFSITGRALLDAGHDVMILTSPQLKGHVIRQGLKPILNPISEEADFNVQYDQKIDIFQQETFFKKLNSLRPMFQKLCQETNENALLMTFLSDQKFDLVIIDGMTLRHCMYTIPFRLAVPYVLFSTMPDPWSSGVPALPSFEPSILQTATNEMSLIERAKTTINYLILYSGLLSGNFEVGSVVSGHSFPTLRELHHRAEMVLINIEVTCVDYPRASLPHYQFVGGACPRPREKLDPELADWMSWAPHGVIVVSFGANPNMQKVWDVLGDKLEEALAQMPKWRAVVFRDPTQRKSSKPLPDNIRCYPWLPQDTLLGHQRTRLFITHGGNNGQLESIYHAVPILTLPVVGDQLYNGIRAAKRGYGLVLDLQTSTSEDLLIAMTTLVSNNTYRRNIRKCSDILRSQPSAAEKVVWWVEHVLQFSGAHLRPPTLDMPLYRLFMLDVLCNLLLLFILLLLGFFLCIRLCIKSCRQVCKSQKAKAE